ncbi:MAG: ribosome silencing factor [Chitinophagales bacterium]|nr:ribosome silencing factor [Chitinophagales bacterium]MCZ2393169.1 ribosome silencing factor [Chitinophagales bacterium]
MKISNSLLDKNDNNYLVEQVVEFIQDKKGKDIISLNLSQIPEAIADYFIICHADSYTHVRAIMDNIEHELTQKLGIKNIHIEGRSNGEWVLADIGNVIVHIFQTEKREFYQLEDLWSDALIKIYENT